MFNHHSLIPWGSFRGRQEEKWGSFRVGIISGSIWGSFQGWGSFRGRDHFGGCTDPKHVFLRVQERPATLILTVTSGLRLTRARHVYNRDAETGN